MPLLFNKKNSNILNKTALLNEAGKGTRKQSLQGAAVISLLYNYMKGSSNKEGVGFFSQITSDRISYASRNLD